MLLYLECCKNLLSKGVNILLGQPVQHTFAFEINQSLPQCIPPQIKSNLTQLQYCNAVFGVETVIQALDLTSMQMKRTVEHEWTFICLLGLASECGNIGQHPIMIRNSVKRVSIFLIIEPLLSNR